MRVAALADIHYGKATAGTLGPLLKQIADSADVLLLGGDLTNLGVPEEVQPLAKELSVLKMPIVAVLGNHEFESGRQTEVQHILTDSGVTVLDGDIIEIDGIGIAGAKGFAGGFEQRQLAPWGEPVIKQFVQEAVSEALKLEGALAKLRTRHRIALLHYAPIRATCDGEPPEIMPFLGCSRLEEPLNRYAVTAVFHGHAHRGTFEGRTKGGVPVYNVAMPLLGRKFPDRPPFFVLNVGAESANNQKNTAAPTNARI